MSWLSIPLPNPFKSLQSDDPESPTSSSSHGGGGGGGVKEDFSALGQTIDRQLRGVAAFLAPPPPPFSTEENYADDDSSPSLPSLSGIRNDLVEIGGSFKSGLLLLSSNKTVTEISRFASNFLQFQNEEHEDDDEDEGNRNHDYGGVAGITEEVVEFVKEISMLPECWTEFPLSLDNDFCMSDAQRKHASTIEHLTPSVASLRLELCTHMSDEHFWMIYFTFLLPRLNENDFNLLSSPEIVETREVLLQQLKDKRNAQDNPECSDIVKSSQEGSQAGKNQGENRSSLELLPQAVTATEVIKVDEEMNIKHWLEEKDIGNGSPVKDPKQLKNDEDVSFSDLEDDDNDLSGKLSDYKPEHDIGSSSPNGSNDWVQLNDNFESRRGQQKANQTSREKYSDGEESNGWLTIDDFDSDSLAAM